MTLKSETAHLPRILQEEKPEDAVRFARRLFQNYNDADPEILTLLLTQELPDHVIENILELFFKRKIHSSPDLIFSLQHIARIGFSFPLWRFPAMSFSGGSLFERAGLKKIIRDTDIFDARLPEPQRDLFGCAFLYCAENTYIEYRRAYILCQDRNLSLLIRNNSHYFGRDRLPHMAYVSCRQHDINALMKIDTDFLNAEKFEPLQNIPEENFSPVAALLKNFIAFDRTLYDDFFNDLPQLEIMAQKNIFVGRIDSSLPPWYPQNVTPLARFVQKDIKKSQRLVFLSGQGGDRPA